MRRLVRTVTLGLSLATEALGSATLASAAPDETMSFGPFGLVHVYAPAGSPDQVVLFVSGDGGWTLGVIPMARRLAALGALVVGIDIRKYLASLESSGTCAYPAGSLEELARAIELRHHLAEYERPILVGYSSGATLVYAAAAQAPAETFKGVISLGFCSDVPLQKPLCRGRGLVSRPLSKGHGRDLDPMSELRVPWSVLQGEIDQVCAPADTARFVGQVRSGKVIALPKVGHGFSVATRWESQYVAAYQALATQPAASAAGAGERVADAASLSDLGLVEVRATAPPGDVMAILLTGDGGWAEIDRKLAAALAASGVSSVGWSSLRYYWTPRTPEAAARDLSRVIAHYSQAWAARRVLLVGYSFGADVLPFLVTRLAPGQRERIARVALLGLSPDATFEFHVTDWLGLDRGHHPTAPEVERLAPVPVLCLRGDDEGDSACESIRGSSHVKKLTLPGGHHFGGDYERIARALLDGVEAPAAQPFGAERR